MEIIIIGCGKVGLTIAEQLGKENHNLVMVDTSAERIQALSEDVDALKLVGNGASINTQLEAGVETADILIAVTGSDELNLLCCLIAKKVGHCHTIARVRNPIYSQEISFIKEQLGISMIINPELAAAMEISRILRFPSAIKIDMFAKGKVELLKFKLEPEFHLNNLRVMDVDSQLRCDVLICGVERGEEVVIPDGNFVLHDDDKISILATSRNSTEFFKKIGIQTNQVKNTMVVGGGTIAYYLAQLLTAMHIKVKIVEKDKKRCEQLAELLDDTLIINGDGTDKRILMKEGLADAESFVTLTNIDEENILLSLFARDNSQAKLITKITRIAFDELIGKMDIGSIIYPKYITADYIIQYVRAMQNSIGSNVEVLYHILDGMAEALEFIIQEESSVTGIPLMELNLKDNLLIGSINRKGESHIPRGQDSLELGDRVIVVTTHKGLHDIRDILKK
ncbi:MAG: Trk system potassium transporter TrkA [Clostridium sp.]